MQNKDNILDYVPLQDCPWNTDDKGLVYLIREKTKNRLLKKIIGWLNRSQEFHIHLDALGSAAWLAADGRRTVSEIAVVLRRESAGELAQAELRLAKFFALLVRDGFARWRHLDAEEGSAAAPRPPGAGRKKYFS